MADVRSLLRSELASRGSSGQSGSTGTRVTKKRKIEATDDLIRKKSRPTTPGLEQTSEHSDAADIISRDQQLKTATDHATLHEDEAGPSLPPSNDENEDVFDDKEPFIVSPELQPAPPKQLVDEDEWAAFERDVVAPTRTAQIPAAAFAAAIISAAPVSADELAVQQQKQKEGQDLEHEDAEGEREDAARHLEEEFEEMEQLEERVKRLKAKREELRRHRAEDENTNATVEAQNTTQQEGYESEEEDEVDADWDDWRFR
ncbi:hypothetical protein BGW36DRAFT_421490 [Talaromyces proteolyticus]|uniref:Uncharacterized protein n=1 Tax=Talaromyces proteolyticus TaxID=1131652 RepID=A0AAD4Q5S2_9EURO|nr:uncharacterized protein BGW36DRAFT_421490 [Talaromyces proteolyticus]KAH8704906.1 hypothetical protein BGW36DRAFT_421490 [Talaromyces proteolyticus]